MLNFYFIFIIGLGIITPEIIIINIFFIITYLHKKGPDFVWHIDGYDKLKPYGFPIHFCIDG